MVRQCDGYEKNKPENTSPVRLLQPLPFPKAIWEEISMDFVGAFSTSQGKNTILVVEDTLSTYENFINLSHPYIALMVS